MSSSLQLGMSSYCRFPLKNKKKIKLGLIWPKMKNGPRHFFAKLFFIRSIFLCLAWLLHRLSFLSNRQIFPSTWELYCSSVEFFFLPVLRKVSIDNSIGEIWLSVPLLRWLCNNKIEHFRRCRNLELGKSFVIKGLPIPFLQTQRQALNFIHDSL